MIQLCAGVNPFSYLLHQSIVFSAPANFYLYNGHALNTQYLRHLFLCQPKCQSFLFQLFPNVFGLSNLLPYLFSYFRMRFEVSD